MIIYLYKKTHNKTGLKYLGKTTRDPFKYGGSGKDWVPHIKKHGYDVTTEILKECSTKEELSRWGRYYSKLWNIVESLEWANRIPESGGGPGRRGHHAGPNNPMFGKKRPDLSGENSINKTPEKRLKSSIGSKKLWQTPGFREKACMDRRNKWKDPSYIEKMKNRPRTFKKCNIMGVAYKSLKDASAHLGLDPSTVSKRCSSSHPKFADWSYTK